MRLFCCFLNRKEFASIRGKYEKNIQSLESLMANAPLQDLTRATAVDNYGHSNKSSSSRYTALENLSIQQLERLLRDPIAINAHGKSQQYQRTFLKC